MKYIRMVVLVVGGIGIGVASWPLVYHKNFLKIHMLNQCFKGNYRALVKYDNKSPLICVNVKESEEKK